MTLCLPSLMTVHLTSTRNMVTQNCERDRLALVVDANSFFLLNMGYKTGHECSRYQPRQMEYDVSVLNNFRLFE